MRDFDPTASEFISSGYIDRSRPGGALYDFMSIASVAAPIIGGMFGDDAAGDAASAQAGAADRASATQEAARRQQREDSMPWMQGGTAANNNLLYRLGIGNNPGTPGAPGSASWQSFYDKAFSQLDATHQQQYGMGFNASPDEASKALRLRELRDQVDAQYAASSQGQAAANDPMKGSLLKAFDQSDLNNDLVYQNGLQFGLNTGVNQLNQRAAAGGNYGSGAALKALTRFGNDYATTKTAGAYDRNMQGKQQTYNFLSGVSQQGQNAAAGVGAAGLSAANNIANNQLGAGNAQAAGIVGGANALSGGLAGATNAYQWNQLMSKPKSSYGLSNSWDIPMQAGGGY